MTPHCNILKEAQNRTCIGMTFGEYIHLGPRFNREQLNKVN